jgi:autotransporter passenger strand-loop-strand repeat protein/probable HAF family extracellular repeat protein
MTVDYNFTELNDPSARSGTTAAFGINSGGEVVGTYTDIQGKYHGFIYNGATWKPLDYPGGSVTPNAVNNAGEVVGALYVSSGSSLGLHGFLYSGGAFTLLDDPSAAPTSSGGFTNTNGINDFGDMTGGYSDGAETEAFFYSAGTWTTLDDPSGNGTYTYANGINNSDEIVGQYTDSSNVTHGFLYDPHAANPWTTLDYPGATSTEAQGINNLGQIVGFYYDTSAGLHGFLYDNGDWTNFDYFGAGSGTYEGTFFSGINDAGEIVGAVQYSNSGESGFIAKPSDAIKVEFSGPLTEGTDDTLDITLAVAPTSDETIDLTVTPDTIPANDVVGIPTSVDVKAGQTTITIPFQIEQDPLDTAATETFTVSATSPAGDANVSASVKDFDSNPFAFTHSGGFQYNSSTKQMTASGEVDVGLIVDGGSTLVSIDSTTATYDGNQFTVSGTVIEDVTGDDDELFQGSFVLPYTGFSTSKLTDKGPFAGKFDLGGIPITITQLTFESGEVLAAFDVSLPFTGGNVTLNTSQLGVNFGLEFDDSGVSLGAGGTVTLPDTGPLNVFGIFTGSTSNVSISYVAASDILKLQGTFAATKILGFSAAATVDLSGNNFIQYQNGQTDFVGSLKMTEDVTPNEPFAFKEIDLSVNTIQKTFSGAVDFVFPFGGEVPEGNVKLVGSWGTGPTVNEVDVAFSNFSIPIPDTPDMVWTSASVGVKNMFVNNAPITFSGSLGFAFGPQVSSTYIASLTLSGSGSSQQLTAGYQLSMVPFAVANSIANFGIGDLSNFQSLFPLIKSTGTVTANFASGGFKDLTLNGTTNIFGDFITTSAQIQTDSYLDFTASGVATVDFGNAVFAKYISNGPKVQANFLASFTDAGPLSGDYAEAWFSSNVNLGVGSVNFTIGAKVDLDGDVSVLFEAPSNAPQGAPALAAAESGPGSPPADPPASYLFLTDTWTTAATAPVTLTVTSNGQSIPQANFADNGIAIVSALTTDFSETVVILNPTAGATWTVSASDGVDDLGTQTVTSATPDTAPSITSVSLATLNSENLTVDYNLANAGSATISFFADKDGQNFDGVLLGTSSSLSNGTGSATVSLNNLTGGFWHVYALISDGVSMPSEAYASAGVLINAAGTGGQILSPVIVSGGQTLTVSKSQTSAALEILSAGVVKVLSGGSTIAAAIYSGGSELISAGGSDAGAQVFSGGLQTVSGIETGAAITGTASVAAGGRVSGATIYSGGLLVDSGLTAATMVAGGGTEQIRSGATDSGTTLIGGSLQVLSGTAVGTTVGSGAEADVEKGGKTSAAVISGTLLDFGVTNGATVLGGSQVIESGGTASNTILSGGSEVVSAHGTDVGAQILGGTQFVYGLANGAAISSGGSQLVESGGSTSGAKIAGGFQDVYQAGLATSTTISSGGTQDVSGTARGTTIGFGGTEIVSAGGTTASTTISSGGMAIVSAGATAIDAAIKGGGIEIVAGGTDFSGTISSGATLEATGSALLSKTAFLSGGTAELGPGFVGSNLSIANSVTAVILSGGTLSSSTVSAGGTVILESGGTASSTTVSSGGAVEFIGVNFNSAGADFTFATRAIIELGSGAVDNGESVNNDATLRILASGSDSGTTVLSGSLVQVLSGGFATGLTISSGGTALVSSGGTAIDTNILSSGTETASSGGTAIDPTILSGGTLIVSSGGLVDVQSGATNSGKLINSATIDVESGATLTLSGTTSNAGTLFADGAGSLIDIVGVVSGGTTEVGDGTVEIAGASKENISFLSNGSGILELNSATTYTGKISNFGVATSAHSDHNEQLDLTAITYSSSTVSETYSGSTASGVLKVVSGATTVATISMTGAYVTSDFTLAAGSGGSGTIITDPSGGIVHSANAALLGNYMAGSFVVAAGGQGGPVISNAWQGELPLLAHSHT